MGRSPNYPGVSLREAVNLAETLYEEFDRKEMTDMEAVEEWGYTALSGTSRRKLAALKHYGLLDNREDGVAVSDRTLAILRPADPNERIAELKKALYEPNVFRGIQEDFEDLPTTGRLTAYLVRDKGFSDDASKKVDEVFRESIEFMAEQVDELEGAKDEDESGETQEGSGESTAEDTGTGYIKGDRTNEDLMEYKMNLSRDAVAHLVLSGEVKESDLWLLRSFLANAQMAVLNSVADNLREEEAEELRSEIIDDLRGK